MESGAKEEGTLRAVTRASGHNWMVKVPFGEERRARRQASWGDMGRHDHEFGLGHIDFEILVSHPG